MQPSEKKQVFIVMPALNEAKVIGGVIEELVAQGFSNIIVINDGSFDNTGEVIDSMNVLAMHHAINRGKGAATQTGLDAAKLLNANYVVTIDADGQHNPADIERLVEPLLFGKCDVVLGSRFLHKQSIPPLRKVVNTFGNLITFFLYGIYVSDSQSGMRAYNRKALEKIKTSFDRYEFESEVLSQIKIHGLSYIEIPIEVRYNKHSLDKYKGLKVERQSALNGFRMIFRMIIRNITT